MWAVTRRLVRFCNDERHYSVLTLHDKRYGPIYDEPMLEIWGRRRCRCTLSENAWHCIEMQVGPPFGHHADGALGRRGQHRHVDRRLPPTPHSVTSVQIGDVGVATGTLTGTRHAAIWTNVGHDQLRITDRWQTSRRPAPRPRARWNGRGHRRPPIPPRQLSANWDAGTDADSGISGYQYAIGTYGRRHANVAELDLAGQRDRRDANRLVADLWSDLLSSACEPLTALE